ncbi:MAG: hypothetical protein IID45_00360 [Planctomycetes bacterium]|nr:hypothetical protein [Planctomycetota bacterium]
MPHTVTCACGKRITVGPNSERTMIDCPECGESVPCNGAAESKPLLSFGVQKIGGREQPADERKPDAPQIDFDCPSCGRQFQESQQAAGKRTRCPQCQNDFVIPDGSPPPIPSAAAVSGATSPAKPSPSLKAAPPQTADASPATAAAEQPGVDAAVAAYNAGKATAPDGTVKRGFITRRSMIPIGLLLMLLGGGASIVGTIFAMNGMRKGLSDAGLTGSGNLQGDDGIIAREKKRAKAIADLAQEPALLDGRDPLDDIIRALNDRNRQMADERRKAQQRLDDAKEKREEDQSSGQAMLIGGVITGGVGTLMSFIGGIFLLAGLIGRFLEKPQPLPQSGK